MFLICSNKEKYTSLQDYFDENSPLSTNSILKITQLLCVAVASVGAFIVIQQLLPSNYFIEKSIALIKTPWGSTVILSGNILALALLSLFLCVRDQKAAKKLQAFIDGSGTQK